MLKNIFFTVLAMCLFNCSYAWQVKYIKEAKLIAFEKQNSQLFKYLNKNFIHTRSTSLNTGYFAGNDSVNLKPNLRRITIASFYLSKYETSVSEYMEFCKVNNGIYDGISLYPIIENPVGEFPYPSFKAYLEDKKYQNHPIVGVNKEQSMAYCKWFSGIIMGKYNLNKEAYVYFILPTKAMFETAVSLSCVKKDEFKKLNTNLPGAPYSLYANYKKADKSSFELLAINKNKSLNNKFYNLLGNVAEWSLDTARDEYLGEMQNDKYVKTNELSFKVPINLINETASPGLVLGGAYNLDSFYLQPAVMVPVNPDKGYGWVGFRVAGFVSTK